MQHSTSELQTLSGTNISTKTAPGASWREFSWLSSFCRGDVEGSSTLVSLAGTTVFGGRPRRGLTMVPGPGRSPCTSEK